MLSISDWFKSIIGVSDSLFIQIVLLSMAFIVFVEFYNNMFKALFSFFHSRRKE